MLDLLPGGRKESLFRNEVLPFFKNYWKTSAERTWDEQALPSYLHSIFFVRYVFWKRLSASIKVADPGDTALDFGCGAGALFPWLRRMYKKVLALDVDAKSQKAAREICQNMNWTNIDVLAQTSTQSIESHSIDTIFALDVLEHVEDLPTLLLDFKRILKANGKLIVSSPTENFTYKLVRKFAGPGYQGEYHLRAAKEVEDDLAKLFKVKLKKRIFPVFTFFRIVTATNLVSK